MKSGGQEQLSLESSGLCSLSLRSSKILTAERAWTPRHLLAHLIEEETVGNSYACPSACRFDAPAFKDAPVERCGGRASYESRWANSSRVEVALTNDEIAGIGQQHELLRINIHVVQFE